MMREELRRGEKGEMSESAIVRRCDSMQVEKHGRAFESIARRCDSMQVEKHGRAFESIARRYEGAKGRRGEEAMS
jgi:hypothetical protein